MPKVRGKWGLLREGWKTARVVWVVGWEERVLIARV